jgi:hypothetical protein
VSQEDRSIMRTVTMVALVGGFFAGIVLSEIIGIAGFLLFGSIVGFKFLPIVSALVAGGAAVVVNLLRDAGQPPSTHPGSAADHEAVRHRPRP